MEGTAPLSPPPPTGSGMWPWPGAGLAEEPRRANCFPAGGNSSHPPSPAPHPLANSTEPPLGGRAGWAATCEGACPGGTRPRPYPPGVAFFQRCTLGLGRVLDDSSRLPRKIHRHEGVLRDAALESKGHPFLGCSRWEPWPGGATRTREGQERTASAPTSQPSKDQVTPSAPQGLWFFSRRRNELILSRLLVPTGFGLRNPLQAL